MASVPSLFLLVGARQVRESFFFPFPPLTLSLSLSERFRGSRFPPRALTCRRAVRARGSSIRTPPFSSVMPVWPLPSRAHKNDLAYPSVPPGEHPPFFPDPRGILPCWLILALHTRHPYRQLFSPLYGAIFLSFFLPTGVLWIDSISLSLAPERARVCLGGSP